MNNGIKKKEENTFPAEETEEKARCTVKKELKRVVDMNTRFSLAINRITIKF